MRLLSDLGIRNRINSRRSDHWGLFECDYCKREVEKMFRNGVRDKSCGCQRYILSGDSNSTHGYSRSSGRHPLYSIINAIIQRCTDPNVACYERYGARGITVCDEWLLNRSAFVVWGISHGYRAGLQIDRIDNNSGYSPDNCRFTNVSENCRNRRSTILNASIVEQMRSDYASGSYKKIEIAKKYNISPSHTHRVLTGISW